MASCIFLDIYRFKYIYTVAPDARIPSKFMNAGALFATIGIILITLGYSLYVNYFSNYTLFMEVFPVLLC